MKSIFTLLLLPALFLAPACGGDSVEGADGLKEVAGKAGGMMESVKGLGDLDVSSLDPAALKEKFSGVTEALSGGLSKVTDLASAQKLATAFGPVMDKLGSMKSMLGDKVPDMSSLTDAVSGLKSKFSGDAGIMGALKPILDKIMAMVS